MKKFCQWRYAVVSSILTYVLSSGSDSSMDVNEDFYSEKYLRSHVNTLTHQILLQQFFKEQRVRSEGHSGLHLVRQRRSGDKNYFVESYNGYAAGSIHDHANNIRTVGLGQFSAVLNGVEFQTRHNDYRLNMPHQTSDEYNAIEPVPFPDVPPEVLNKQDVNEQIEEMREWFKAWQSEDNSTRDYTKYFKPILCYLEGGWTNSGKNVDEPFSSDRHFLDAKTWMGLHEKARYLSYSGSKSRLENLSFLPSKIISIKNGVPSYAQWNYRILCHPLKEYLSVRKIKLVEDLSSRMMTGYNIFRHSLSRAARFDLNKTGTHKPIEGRDLLGELMGQIPGKNNYKGSEKATTNSKMNRFFYHRWFPSKGKDSSGYTNQHRGFSDDTLFVAKTTQPKIAGLEGEKCADLDGTVSCFNVKRKWTYAIPLEIIYLTPLSKWNPYGLTYHGLHVKGTPTTLDGRYGDCVPWKKKELNGTNSKRFYQTPDEFFSGSKKTHKGKADTERPFSCVLNPQGVSHRMRATGIHILMPHIRGVGVVRQRYPIFPVHGEGSSVWKELNALRDIIMDPKKYKHIASWDGFSYADMHFDRFNQTSSTSTTTMRPVKTDPTKTVLTFKVTPSSAGSLKINLNILVSFHFVIFAVLSL